MVFIDETAVHPHMYLKYGRSRRGQRVVSYSKRKGMRYTLIAAMGCDGVIAKRLVKTGMKREDWAKFLTLDLLPLLPEKSILVMDNLNLHKEEWVDSLVRAYDCRAIYLPPYSPDTNPIELLFNVLKLKLRSVSPNGIVALRNELELAVQTITSEMARAFFAHCQLLIPPD